MNSFYLADITNYLLLLSTKKNILECTIMCLKVL